MGGLVLLGAALLLSACDSGPSSVEAPSEPDPVSPPTSDPDPSETDSMTASEYVKKLGRGFDVSYVKTGKYIELYNERAVRDFSEAGFQNIRLRLTNRNLVFDESQDGPRTLHIDELKERVRHVLDHGMYPVLAYTAHQFEEMEPAQAKEHLVEYWTRLAKEFRDFPHEVSFDLLVEITGRYLKDYKRINQFYEATYAAIREIDEDRILIFSPVRRSNSEYLQHLEVPGEDDPYTMVEWHNYAAGPKPDPSSKKYWNDGSTMEERDYIYEIINIAERWRARTGYPLWVGAWMPGNYNKGNDYDIPAQVGFGSFFARQLDEADMPWSVNAGKKFYDYEKNRWYRANPEAGGIPVRDAILDPNKIAVYTDAGYDGTGYRLGPGTYTRADLEEQGLEGDAGSLMVPFDFEVTIYSAGSDTVLTTTQAEIAGVGDSLTVTDRNSY